MKYETTNTESTVIAEAKTHFTAAQAALRKGCEHALFTGIRLIWLHANTAGVGHGGARTSGSSVSHGTLEKGFKGACEEIGIPRANAYRWMDATYKAAIRATLIFEGDGMRRVLALDIHGLLVGGSGAEGGGQFLFAGGTAGELYGPAQAGGSGGGEVR